MNFFAFHIGDYESATLHLSWDEDLAYRRLINTYYKREAPLPLDKKQVYRLVMATSKAQRNAVDTMLEEFFIYTDHGFKHIRCDEEIEKFKAKTDKAKASAEVRWGSANAQETQCDGNAMAMRTHCEGNAPITHNPIPNPKLEEGYVRERGLDDELEKELRNAAGWQLHPSPNLFVTGQIAELIRCGASLDHDVLPIIRRDAPRCRSPNWNYFTKAVAQAKADRIAASNLKFEGKPHAQTNKPRNSFAGAFAIVNAEIDELERRETEIITETNAENVTEFPRLRQIPA